MKIYRSESGDYFEADFGNVEDGAQAPIPDDELNTLARSGELAEHGINIGTYASAKRGEVPRLIAPVPYRLMTDAEKADADGQVATQGKHKGKTRAEIMKIREAEVAEMRKSPKQRREEAKAKAKTEADPAGEAKANPNAAADSTN